MLQIYLKIAFRNLLRNKIFSFIHIIGLSLGITAFVFILEYVSYEYSFNAFHQNLPTLYRVLTEAEFDGKRFTYPYQPPALATISKQQFGEIKHYCRVAHGIGQGVVSRKQTSSEIISFRQDNIAYADGSFFELFTFPILKGKPSELYKPFTVAISKTQAKKYFGKTDGLGKQVDLHNQFGKGTFKIIAVYEDFPENSDIDLDMIFSIETLKSKAYVGTNSWADLNGFDSNFLVTYFQLNPESDFKKLEDKMRAYRKKIRPKSNETYRLQPLQNIHLAQSLSDYYETNGNLAFVYAISATGILILLIAWFNYINLSTATALKRAKEVGIRKVIGANRAQLIFQFLGESFLLNLMSFVLALVLIEITQGTFNWLIGKNLQLSLLSENWFWLWGIGMLLVGSLASGAYTAFVLSGFKPTQILKGVFSKSNRGIQLRKALVVFQFTISIVLIASTFILYSQLQYMQNKDLGINTSQLLVIRGAQVGRDSTYKQKASLFGHYLKSMPFVKQYATSGAVPSKWYNFNTGGITRLNPQEGDDKKAYAFVIISPEYIPTYQIKLVAGKNYQYHDCNKDWMSVDKIILNEKATYSLGFESPEKAIGQKVKWENRELTILGVVKDYHHQSLQSQIDATIFYPQINDNYYTIRLQVDDLKDKLNTLQDAYLKAFPGNPFDYFFVDDVFNKSYKTEQQYGAIFTNASFLAILIACLGLFGLATFTIETRTKEIGIRKVLGASARNIITLISKDFLRLVLISFVIAVPFTWYATTQWLQYFAYRVQISWLIFGFSGLLAVLIALITIGSQAYKASRRNPVEALRCE